MHSDKTVLARYVVYNGLTTTLLKGTLGSLNFTFILSNNVQETMFNTQKY